MFGLNVLPGAGSRKATPPAVDPVMEAASASKSRVLRGLQSHATGLTFQEAADRLAAHGPNEVVHDKPPRWYVQLLRAFVNPFNGVIATLMGVSFVVDVVLADPKEGPDFKTVIVLTIMILLSTLLRFATEFRSAKAAEALKALVHTTATVIRRADENAEPARIEIPMKQVVPGDVVAIAAGDMIPADIRLLTSKDLFVSQSALTGESLPVEKFDTAPTKDGAPKSLVEATNVCLMGTNVVSGAATGVVVVTGSDTFFGQIAETLTARPTETSFDRGVKSVSYLLIKFMLVMVPVVFVINGLTKHDWMEALLFGIAVAVGLTPEMLPMIVSANLAKGAVRMARKKCVVKRINSIQNFGAMDVLCTDKTGTLTQDKIVLEEYVDLQGGHHADVLRFAYLNSLHQTGLKNLLDRAILDHGEINMELSPADHYVKVDEIPFDFQRRRMTVVLEKDRQTHLMICKGAVEEMLSICAFEDVDDNFLDDKFMPLTSEGREQAVRLATEMNERGLRVVAVAYRELPAKDKAYGVQDEKDMVLIGFVGFLDPPKPDAADALKALNDHGVAVKVLTGDNEIVSRNVCRQVGMDPGRIVLGDEVDDIDDAALGELARQTQVFAKLSPLQKERIIRVLQANGHTIGYLGDGINDAAALKTADVGISVDSAADVARESSDIIMLEKDLMILEQGVIEGRNTFGNIMKYIKMTASSNFGNVFSVLVASAFLPFLPMLAIQLLVQNTLYDFSQTAIPFDRVDPEFLAEPRKWRADDIGRFMLFIGPISSIFDIATFCLMWYVFEANNIGAQALFHSGWFVEGLCSQTLIVHMIRTQKIPFIQSRAAWPVILTTACVIGAGMTIPFTHLGGVIGLVPLPWSYFPWLFAILLCYCMLTQTVKTWYIRKFGTWL